MCEKPKLFFPVHAIMEEHLLTPSKSLSDAQPLQYTFALPFPSREQT